MTTLLLLACLGSETPEIREWAEETALVRFDSRTAARHLDSGDPEVRERLVRIRRACMIRELDAYYTDGYPPANTLGWLEHPADRRTLWCAEVEIQRQAFEDAFPEFHEPMMVEIEIPPGWGSLVDADEDAQKAQTRRCLIHYLLRTGDWKTALAYTGGRDGRPKWR